MKLFRYFVVLLFFTVSFSGELALPPARAAATGEIAAVDYSDPANWVRLPEPDQEPLPVDIFYVYPTVVADREQPLMHFDDKKLRRKTGDITDQQTGIFAGLGNVYAPYCRQLEFYRAMEALQQEKPDYCAMAVGAEDVRQAFLYYLAHYNEGRPFILLGHSQGAMDLLMLMEREFQRPELQDKLIAAYLIGVAITPEELKAFPHLTAAAAATDTGVIVSYNTVAPDAAPSPFEKPAAVCINPLNWRTDGTPAAAEENLGAVFFDGHNKVTAVVPEFCGAAVDPERGVLLVELAEPDQYDARIMGHGIYHMNDLYFFYRNLAANAAERIKSYRARSRTAAERQ